MNQIIMILLISALILVHEIGHFIAARMCGVRVTRFGFGMPMGPTWRLFKWKDTTFYIHAFLFGGYVSFPDDSMNDTEVNEEKIEVPQRNENETLIKKLKRKYLEFKKKEQDDMLKQLEDENLPSDSPELYENKTIGQKLFIVSAGVIMNIIFAIILVIACATYYHKLPSSSQDIFIGSISDKATSNINKYDVRKNDKIVEINNIKIDSMYQIRFLLKSSKLFDDYAQENLIEYNLSELKKLNPDIQNTIKKDVLILLPETKNEDTLSVNKNITIGLEKYRPQGKKLSQEQINLRDEVYGKRVYKPESDISIDDLAMALSDTYKPMNIKLLRNDKEIILDDVVIDKDGHLGFVPVIVNKYIETKTFKDIILKSCNYIYTTTVMMLFSLWQLFTGKISAADMHGVIAIVKVGGDIIASYGMLNGILLTAMISINLAIMNFLPIPALDGGHVMFLVIEKLTGKKPGRELAEKINNIFFVLLIILMIAICYNDIVALITKKL